ncbi:MAG: PIG-L deacetylase family protein [Rhodothermaceae bacterium]
MEVLILSAHPDDETLGAGGTIFKHLDNGDTISWYLATSSDPEFYSVEQISNQEKFVQKIKSSFKVKNFHWSKFPTAKLDLIPFKEIIDDLKVIISKVNPDIIYLPGNYDIHSDHTILNKALFSAVKSFNIKKTQFRILTYEVLSSTEVFSSARKEVFIPNSFVDITECIIQKIELMEFIVDETQPYPLPRCMESIKALSKYRGANIGVEFAEAFNIIFEKK